MVPPSLRSVPSYALLQNRNHGLKLRQRSTRSLPDQCFNFHVRWMSTIANEEKGAGDNIYQQALLLTEEADDLDRKKEEKRSSMMYEAYQRSKEKELNPKSQGVTVVKTLVKQVRKERTKNDDSSDKREKALELLKQAANEYNHPDAAVQLGNMLLKKASRSLNNRGKKDDGLDPKESVGRAMELFQRAGDAGFRVGYYNLGHLLWTGFPPQGDIKGETEEQSEELQDSYIVVADMEEAMNAFNKAIELGDSDAMYLVGVHELGQADVKSNQVGFNLIERAAENGHEGALYHLALLVSNLSSGRRKVFEITRCTHQLRPDCLI